MRLNANNGKVDFDGMGDTKTSDNFTNRNQRRNNGNSRVRVEGAETGKTIRQS